MTQFNVGDCVRVTCERSIVMGHDGYQAGYLNRGDMGIVAPPVDHNVNVHFFNGIVAKFVVPEQWFEKVTDEGLT